MKLMYCELLKILRRRVVQVALIAFALLNLLNLMLNYRLAYRTPEEREWFAAQQTIIRSMEGPITNEMAARIMTRYEELRNNTGSEEYVLGSREKDLSIYEMQVAKLEELYDYQLRDAQLKESIAKRLDTLNGDNHIYEIRRLKLMQSTYSARKVDSYYELTGFEAEKYYMGYDFSTFLVMLLLLVGITPLFCGEREYGMDVLLKTARRGRQYTVWCKIAASLLFTVICALVLFVTDLVYFQSIYPFDMLHAKLYSAPTFFNTPLNVTVGGFILLNWSAKIVGLWVVGLVMALLSSLCNRTYMAFFFGAGYAGVMMALGDRILLFNPLSLVTISSRVKEFETVNFLGSPVLSIVILPVAALVMALVLMGLIHVSQSHQSSVMWSLPTWVRRPVIRRQRLVYSGGGEWRKLMIKQRLAVVLLVVLAIKVFSAASASTYMYFDTPSQQKEYNAIIAQIGGPIDEDTARFFEEETQRKQQDEQAEFELLAAYQAGELTEAEYEQKRQEYVPRSTVSQSVWQQLQKDHIYALENPEQRWLADTRGWASSHMLGEGSLDVLAVLLVVVLSGVGFSFETESGMSSVLRSCRNGRWRLALSKVAVTTMCTVGVFVVFEGIALLNAVMRYDLVTALQYPLQTLSPFQNSTVSLTIAQAYVRSRLLRLLGLLFVQAITMAFSAGTRRSLTALFSGLTIVMLPYFALKGRSELYLLPLPTPLLAASGVFSQPTIPRLYWVVVMISAVSVVLLTVVSVWKYAAKARGEQNV